MSTLTLAIALLAAVPANASSEEEEPRVLPEGVVEIQVENLHCKTCAKKLARKLYTTPGVKRVRTYVDKNLAIIELQPEKEVELAKLWKAAKLADQKPIELLVLDKKFVAKDFEEAEEKTAQRPTAPNPHR